MTLLYRAGRQLWKVRFVMLLSLAAALLSLYAGYRLFQTYGLAPADGGVLAPLWQRAAWGVTVGGLGVGFAVGMWFYGRNYVSQMTLLAEGSRVRLKMLTFIGSTTAEIPLSDFKGAGYHEGKFCDPRTGRLMVDAPWLAVRATGRRFPLVLDLQGEIPDARKLHGVLEGKMPPG